MTLEQSSVLDSRDANMREVQFELLARGYDEALSKDDINIILEDLGHLPVRANSFKPSNTQERRIASAIDSVEIL